MRRVVVVVAKRANDSGIHTPSKRMRCARHAALRFAVYFLVDTCVNEAINFSSR